MGALLSLETQAQVVCEAGLGVSTEDPGEGAVKSNDKGESSTQSKNTSLGLDEISLAAELEAGVGVVGLSPRATGLM